MYEQAQKEKFVTTMVNNVDYYNKELTIKHLLDFLKANPNFSPREAIRSFDFLIQRPPMMRLFLSLRPPDSVLQPISIVQIDKSHI